MKKQYEYKITVSIDNMEDEVTILRMGFGKEWDNSDWTLTDDRETVYDIATSIDENTTIGNWNIEKVEV